MLAPAPIRRLRLALGRSLLLSGLIAGGLVAVTPIAAQAATCPAWGSSIQPPNPGSLNNVLFAVATTSPCNAWAVGYSSDGPLKQSTLIEHWDGLGWTVQSSPNPGSIYNDLLGVAATSAGNAWAVGYSYDGS